MQNETITIGVGVLAGGLSRRMGGQEKSLLALNDQPMLTHILRRVHEQTYTPAILPIINANGDAARFAFAQSPVVADKIDGFAGPLAGIHAMLDWLSSNAPQITHLASIASDTPFFPKNTISELQSALTGENAAIALASSNGHVHPVFGLWSVDLRDDLEEFLLNADTKKVLAFVERHANVIVDFAVENPAEEISDPFFNINTPEDLKIAQSHLNKTSV